MECHTLHTKYYTLPYSYIFIYNIIICINTIMNGMSYVIYDPPKIIVAPETIQSDTYNICIFILLILYYYHLSIFLTSLCYLQMFYY